MDYKTITYERLEEALHVYDHPSGLKVLHVRKPGYNKMTAYFATDYGSIDNVFKVNGKEVRVPDGIAHFLEHKLFEQEDGNMLDKFSRLGSNPNAFTSFTQTAYYFSATENFEENFKMLLDYVQKPWLTDENVEKEKGIIGQEIRMYQDNADWRVFFNLMECLYVNHPIKLEIAGTLESIARINKELLYDCYNTFYTPANMVVVVVADVEPETVFSITDNMIQLKTSQKIEKKYPEEPKEVNAPYREQKLRVSMPLFNMGIKDSVRVRGYDLLKRRTAMNIILSAVMGRSSELFNRLYEEGLINDSFRHEASLDTSYGFLSWGGQSADPKKVSEIIGQELARRAETGLDEETFSRIKKSHEGIFIRSLNSSDIMARELMDSHFTGARFLDLGKVFEEMDLDFVNTIVRDVFHQTAALSVVNPIS